jgi:hypothetical protein
MYKLATLCFSIILIFGITACSKDKPQEQAQTSQPAQQQAQPQAGFSAATPAADTVKGKVLESMDASGYTYLNVETDTGERWIAVNQANVEVGEEITYIDGIVMQNFFSKTLDRTFPEIIFSSGLVGSEAASSSQASAGASSFSQALSTEGATGAPATGDLMTGSKKAVVPFAEINVEKALGENSYTVEEVYSKAADLNGQTVVVRGKVMKVSPRIMGRNWIHIQDGTGSPEANTHDLVITTSQEVDAGQEIITMEGVLTANKDFGSGYSYAVIIEEASVKE